VIEEAAGPKYAAALKVLDPWLTVCVPTWEKPAGVDGDHVGGVLLPLVRSPKSTSELVEPGVAPSLKTGALLEPDKLLLTKPMLALGSPVIVTTWRFP